MYIEPKKKSALLKENVSVQIVFIATVCNHVSVSIEVNINIIKNSFWLAR